jgi:hypothetical protein
MRDLADTHSGAVMDANSAQMTDAWRAARSGQWARWPGLPAEVSAAAVMAELAGIAPPAAVASQLGRSAVDRYDTPRLRVWAATGVAILVEWIDPPCAGAVSELLDALGPPDREAAGRHLTIAESYDQPPSFAPRLAAVQLFAATDLRTFVIELGGNDTTGPSR